MDAMTLRADAPAILIEELERLKERIIANHIAAGQKASGRTIDSLKVAGEPLADGYAAELDARAYFAGIETGSRQWSTIHTRQRKDGTEYPSAPKWFIDVIRDWASVKGVALDSPWGVATKIMTDGSALFRDGGRDDIFTNEIPSTLDNISSRLAGLFDVQMTESILRTIKQ